VSAALASWWLNPVSAMLVSVVVWLVMVCTLTSLVAIIRLGEIPLTGLLSQRRRLLPGYPRRGDAYPALILFVQLATGLLLLLFALASARASRLLGSGMGTLLGCLLVGWLAAVLLAFWGARGARAETISVLALIALRPWTPLLILLARGEVSDQATVGKEEAADDHEVQAFIDVGEDAGILEGEDAELVASIVDLSDTVAREIMTPRTDVVAVTVDTQFDALMRRFAESMFTRIPVYRETLDRIEGVVHVKDVLRASVAGGRPSTSSLCRSVLVVPETKPLNELLREFQSSHQQLAVVVDEYGGTSGIVSLEDVIEEIVGEIRDEHRREAPEVEKEGDGVFVLHGGAHVEVLEELFGVSTDDLEVDSVGGLVLDRLGHMPRVGEMTDWDGLELEVLELDRRRLRRIRVRRPVREDA
jgi:putative hemolysin